MSDPTFKSRRRGVHSDRSVTQQKPDEDWAELGSAKHRAAFKARLEKARKDPTGAANAEKLVINRSREQQDEAVLVGSIVAYEAAVALKKSPEKWKEFVEDSFWSDFGGHKPDAGKPKQHLRWMMIFFHEAKNPQGKSRANVYRGALQAKFNKGERPESLLAYIKRAGGINAAYRAALPGKKVRSTENASASKSASHVDSGDEGAARLLLSKADEIRGSDFEPTLVKLTSVDFKKVTQRYVETGIVNLQCRLTLGVDGWVEMTCIKAWRPQANT